MAALVLASNVEAPPDGRYAELARAVAQLRVAKDLRKVSAWQGVADVLAKRFAHATDMVTAKRRLAAAVPPFDTYLNDEGDMFNWYKDAKSVWRVGGTHPGLLGNAWVGLPEKRGERDPYDDFQVLFWFERTLSGWSGQPLMIGRWFRDDFKRVVDPSDALTEGDHLAIVGINDDLTNFSPAGALVFKRKGSVWFLKQKVLGEAEGTRAHFGRVNGRKTLGTLIVEDRVYLFEISQSHGGAKRYFQEHYRFENGRYRWRTTLALPSAIATLDDMIWWAKHKDLASLRKRCATPSMARRFAAMVTHIPGDHRFRQSFELRNGADDDDTVFELEGTKTRLRFRHVGRGWILSSMRKVR